MGDKKEQGTVPGLAKEDADRIRELIADAVGKEFSERWEDFARQPKRRYVNTSAAAPQSDDSAEKPKVEPGILAARAIRYMVMSGGSPTVTAEIAESRGDKYIASVYEKALGANDFSAGGALLPGEFANEIIELLAPASVVMSSGVSRRPMSGTLTMPYIDSGASASYVGENQNAQASQPSFGQLQLSSKKLVALVPESNDLIRRGGPAADRAIRDDVVRALRVKMDSALIRSQGASGEPKGMRYWAQAANVFGTAGTTLDNVTTDLGTCIRKLMDENVDLMGSGWLLEPRAWQHLTTIRDGNGNLVYKPEMDGGTLYGYPFKVTTQIPSNLGGGSDEAEIYFANFPTLVLGEEEGMLMQAFDGGAYIDSGSSMVSGVSQDQTVIRAIALHDFGARQRGKEIAVVTGVQYGA